MKSGHAFALAFGIAAVVASPSPAQFRGPGRGDQQAGRHGWLFSLSEGKARAKASGKPLMVVLRCVP